MNEDFVQRLRSSAAAPRFRLVTPTPSGLSFDPATGTLSGTPNIPAGGTFTVTIERFNPYNSALRSYQLVVAPAPLPSLAVFRAANGLAANGSQDAEAPAGDGVANLLKYAFNLIGTGPGQRLSLDDPNSAILAPDGTVGLPLIALDPAGRLTTTYIRRKASDSPGIIYAVQFSETLASGSWYTNPAANTTITSVDGNWERVFVRDSEPTPTRLFARVAVTLGSASMPVIASPSSATATINGVFSYAIGASNSPTAYSATGLPPGLTLDPATGIISGTATVEGIYTVTIGVENAAGIATQILTIAVQPLWPTITSATTAAGTVGVAFNYQLTATSSPTSYGLVSGSLPPGLSLNVTTGLISGTPTNSGAYTTGFTASNSGGSSATVVVAFTIGFTGPADTLLQWTSYTGNPGNTGNSQSNTPRIANLRNPDLQVSSGVLTASAAYLNTGVHPTWSSNMFPGRGGNFPADLATAMTNNFHAFITITPVAGKSYSVSNISFYAYNSTQVSANARAQLVFSNNGFTTHTTLGAALPLTVNGALLSVDTTGIAALQSVTAATEFRVYFHGHLQWAGIGLGGNPASATPAFRIAGTTE